MLRTEHYLTYNYLTCMGSDCDYPIKLNSTLLLRNLPWDAIRMTAAGVLSTKTGKRVCSTRGTGEAAAEVTWHLLRILSRSRLSTPV